MPRKLTPEERKVLAALIAGIKVIVWEDPSLYSAWYAPDGMPFQPLTCATVGFECPEKNNPAVVTSVGDREIASSRHGAVGVKPKACVLCTLDLAQAIEMLEEA